MKKRELLHEGKAKRVYLTDDPFLVIQEFKDDATAFDGVKKGTIKGKGIINNTVSCCLFKYLEENGVRTHFVEKLSENSMLVKRLEIILVEVIVRNKVAGSLVKRIGLEEGTPLPFPIIEQYYKKDELHDPMINSYHIQALGLAKKVEEKEMVASALRVNELLMDFFRERNIELVDMKLEFGRYQSQILLGDEISSDTCRFWDITTMKKLDKDRFRFDMGDVESSYEFVFRKVCGEEP
ncbi:MAG: phosphoribosylaminoimidazolesuccinocarboxamide synthase [Candidatus Glassbacteria bacterium]